MANDVQDPSLQNPDDLSATEFKRRKRNTANQQLQGIADTAAAGAGALAASQTKTNAAAQQNARQQAARNLSASWGAAGGQPIGGGGALADAQQSAMDLAASQSQYTASTSDEQARALAAANLAAQQMAYDATAASVEAGNVGTDLAADLAAANSRLDTIYKDNADQGLFNDDDEDEMNRQMQAEADKAWAAGNRKLAEWWESKIGTGDASGGQLPWSNATPEQRANAQ